MSVTGTIPLSKFQAAIEATDFIAVAATRKQPMMSGTLSETNEKVMPVEQRGSLTRHYRSFSVKRFVELSGMEVAPTYDDLPWFLNHFCSSNWRTGGDTKVGTPTAVTARRYDFVPKLTTDDLPTVTWEVGDDTQAYSVSGCRGNRFELSFGTGRPATMLVDYLGRSAIPVAYTSNLSDRVVEDLAGANAKAYIDTATIGTTQVYTVLDARFSLSNNVSQFWVLDGSLSPRDAYRGEARTAELEMTLAFTDTVEYLAFTSNTTRKIRVEVPGSSISGTSPATTKNVTIDWYGTWSEAPFGDQDGLRVIKVKGMSQYNAAAGHDWKISVVNDVTPLVG